MNNEHIGSDPFGLKIENKFHEDSLLFSIDKHGIELYQESITVSLLTPRFKF
jgi:hypothetical protein